MAAFLSFHAPGFWLVVSLLCMLAATAAQPFLPRAWRGFVLLAVWLGVPYLALISGGVSPRLLGLRYLDWAVTFRLGAGILLAVAVMAGIVRLVTAGLVGNTTSAGAARRGVSLAALLRGFGWSGAEELNWCFWRGALRELILVAAVPIGLPAYWAVWLAAAVNLPFALLLQPNGWQRIVKAAILAVTSVVFFYTGNFWLCWLVHSVVWIILAPAVTSGAGQGQSVMAYEPQATTKTPGLVKRPGA